MGVRTYVGVMFGVFVDPAMFTQLAGSFDTGGLIGDYERHLCGEVEGRWSSAGMKLCRKEAPYTSIDAKPHVVGFWVALEGGMDWDDFDCATFPRAPLRHLFFTEETLPEEYKQALTKAKERWRCFAEYVLRTNGLVLPDAELLLLVDWR